MTPSRLVVGLFLCALAVEGHAAQVQVNGTGSGDDDYLCWSAMPLTISLDSSEASLPEITLRSVSVGPNGGSVGFQQSPTKPNATDHAPANPLTVPVGNGAVNHLWVAGVGLSKNQKDVAVVVEDPYGNEIGRTLVMVRVRQNAENLTADERRRFLEALATVHRLTSGGVGSLFAKFERAHGDAFFIGIHGGPNGLPLFLAWHRAFLLDLERELQRVDPSVALPYWEFDAPAPAVFSLDFMGRVDDGLSIVSWSSANPINGWEMFDGEGAMTRSANGDLASPIPGGRLDDLLDATGNDLYLAINGRFESRYHNGAHAAIGGWLATATSPRDPLFFLLHANVDRAWAIWQNRHQRFDDAGLAAEAYHATGTYPGAADPNRFRKGSYANDRMWPWAPGTDFNDPVDAQDDWPSVPGFAPISHPGGPLAVKPSEMVDAPDADGDGWDLGGCYDEVPFPVTPPPQPAGRPGQPTLLGTGASG